VKQSDAKSLFITETRGTRLQAKLGTYIDTFLASMLLAEVKGTMPGEKGEQMVHAALEKVLDKIEKNQRDDGTFGGTGWANTLSQSMASKGVNRAAQAGYEVSEKVRGKLEMSARAKFDQPSGRFSAAESAGVDLYSSAATLGALQDSDNTNDDLKDELERQVDQAKTPEDREEAKKSLDRFAANKESLKAAKQAIVQKMDDEAFISGFGSNGGEEFLSYMNIGESLVVEGGPEWAAWDSQMAANMNRIQNQDGSWSGHHCITGRNFCTAAALLVLMTDRAPLPVAVAMRRR
jgi:hypothetical protein